MAGITRKVSFYHDRLRRNFYYYTPAGFTGQALPVLFALHGGGGSAEQISGSLTGLFSFRFNEIADQEGFVVVYPNGYDNNWNDGRDNDFSEALRLDLNDVGFIDKIVNKIACRCQIDGDRLYLAGLSNGGTFILRLIQEAATPWAACAICIASLPDNREAGYTLKNRLPILLMNGTADPFILYAGGASPIVPDAGSVISAADLLTLLGQQNGVSFAGLTSEAIANITTADNAAAVKWTYPAGVSEGAKPMVFYQVVNGGHTIPNERLIRPPGTAIYGNACKDFTAVEHIWDFLSAYSR